MRRKPPHIIVTTPESLYILLGSQSGRDMLATCRTVIVDEIHAIAETSGGPSGPLSGTVAALTDIRTRPAVDEDRLVRHSEADRRGGEILVGAGGNERGDDAQRCTIIDSGTYAIAIWRWNCRLRRSRQ